MNAIELSHICKDFGSFAIQDLTLIREQQRHQLESHLAAAAELGRSCGVTEQELTVLLRRAWEESQ